MDCPTLAAKTKTRAQRAPRRGTPARDLEVVERVAKPGSDDLQVDEICVRAAQILTDSHSVEMLHLHMEKNDES